MFRLRETQAPFCRAILDEDAGTLCALVVSDRLPPEKRIGIYRNNVFASLTEALRDTFPVVCRLVDDRFFAYAAHEFIRCHPPERAALNAYGAYFPDFLAGFAWCGELVYLADVARLEWLMNLAANATDADPIAATALADVAAADAPRLTLRLHPSLGFLASPWPVDRIWCANRGDGKFGATIDLAAGGIRLEVSRRGEDVVVRLHVAPTIAFRQALADGATLSAATVLSLASDDRFDLAAALGDLFGDGVVIDLAVAPHVPEATR
jgi:Putative DNA-binding domain